MTRAGHVAVAEATCAAASVRLASEHFEVAILDVMLPDGSGMDLCRSLRANMHERRSYPSAQFSSRNPETRLNSRSLFDTSVSLRYTACAAIKVSSGPMGVPACSSLARTVA